MLAPSRSTLLLALLPAPALGQATLFDLDPTSTGSRYSAGIDLVDDIDGDGISNERELQIGTFPYKPDSDGDGVDDPTEIDAGTDPTDPRVF